MKTLALFEITSEATIEEASKPFRVEVNDGHSYVATLRPFDALAEDEKEEGAIKLQLWIEFDFDGDLAGSAECAKELCAHFINLMATITTCVFVRPIPLRVIDWTVPGDNMRDALILSRHPANDAPFPLLGDELQNTVHRYGGLFGGDAMQAVMRWFRLGIAQEAIEDQFQCFWLCIERLAGMRRTVGRVHDTCQTCQGDLWCEKCGTHPMHRPFPKQVIAEMITEITKDDGESARILTDSRNTLLHGERLEVAGKKHGMTTDGLVDMAAKIARFCMIKAAIDRQDEIREVQLPHATTVAARHLVLRLHVQTVFETGADGLPIGVGPNFEITSRRVDAQPQGAAQPK